MSRYILVTRDSRNVDCEPKGAHTRSIMLRNIACCATWLTVYGADWLDREWANLCCAKQFCGTWLIVYGPHDRLHDYEICNDLLSKSSFSYTLSVITVWMRITTYLHDTACLSYTKSASRTEDSQPHTSVLKLSNDTSRRVEPLYRQVGPTHNHGHCRGGARYLPSSPDFWKNQNVKKCKYIKY
jgi:hypothetical protein